MENADDDVNGDSDKTLYLIRHGESTFNEWRKKSLRNFSWIWTRDPMIFDAPLSSRGLVQVQDLNKQIQCSNWVASVELIISSPLTRAIETAVYGFQGCDVPISIDSRIRERLDTACDIGKQPAELKKAFPSLNFDHLSESWWEEQPGKTDKQKKESYSNLKRRTTEFLTYLKTLEQKHIAIVGHSTFFKRATGARTKLNNCEVQIISLSELLKM